MNPISIPAIRLHQQGIAPHRFTDPAEVVRWMGAIHAQNYHQAAWAIGARLPEGTQNYASYAMRKHHIVRTWSQRDTVHFVPAEDAGWMVALSAQRMIAKDARRLRQLGLDNATLDRCAKIFQKVLAGGESEHRGTLLYHLWAEGIACSGQRGTHIVKHLALRGLICIGPLRGKEQTIALLDDWVPNPRRLNRAESLVELARRYFISRGPATIHDFAWWADLTFTDAREGLEGARPALISEKINDQEYWLAADARATTASSLVLLPCFDEYLLGYTDRDAVLAREHVTKVSPSGNGVFMAVIVSNGQIIGTWKRTIKRQQFITVADRRASKEILVISRQPFTHLTPDQDTAFEAAARRYAAFRGLEVVFD